MEINDDLYGSVMLEEPVLLALLASPVIRRLHGILQHGITGLIGLTEPISRYDHSVGAMLLVRRLGSSLEEQIAALLHDVSHTTLSHVIDYVVDGHDDQSYHERLKAPYLETTALPQLLARYGYDWQDFLHEEDYPLLEQPAPRLCADRIDYFLRDCRGLGLADAAEIQNALAHLVVADGRIAVDDVATARWFGRTFMRADDASWANFREVGLYEVTAQAIRRGLAIGLVSEADFWLTDDQFWARLQAGEDETLQHWLALVSLDTRFVWDEINPTFRVSTKLRAIDPDIVQDGNLQPLSTLDADFARERADYLAGKQGKWPMRVIPPNTPA